MVQYGAMSIFDTKAAEWDTPERRARAHEAGDIIREAVDLRSDMRIIDIGAGTGLLGLDLLADVGAVLLTDPSSGMVEVAQRRIEAEGIVDAEAVIFDVPAAEPPPGAPFDLAVSLMALHHVEDTEATLRSIYALLVPGGHIALMDLDEEDGSFHDPAQPGIHHHGFEAGALTNAATQAGFTDVAVRNVHQVERDGRRYPLFLLTGQRPL
jgi:2-polyprenyl-3-methyl-5-hydroxy-6-metoxy-1,4-benzoquinol methylase